MSTRKEVFMAYMRTHYPVETEAWSKAYAELSKANAELDKARAEWRKADAEWQYLINRVCTENGWDLEKVA